MQYDGTRTISEAKRDKLMFFFANDDKTTPVELSIRNIKRAGRTIPVTKVHAFGHSFLTRRGAVSRVAVQQISRRIMSQHAGPGDGSTRA
jgi:hypothetical protein